MCTPGSPGSLLQVHLVVRSANHNPKYNMAETGPESALLGAVDISHLIDPKCFHQLPVYNPPQPFPLAAPAEIANDVDALYSHQFYRHAAEAARKELVGMSSEELKTNVELQQRLFHLWTTRHAALILTRLGTIAREEARYLDELGADRYRLATTGECIVPWRLRLMVVRAQAGGDTQTGIAKYYTLAREARAEISRLRRKMTADCEGLQKEEDVRELKLWEKRLCNLGLFTSSMLMGTRDTKSALSLLISMHQDCLKFSATEEDYKPFTQQVAFAVALVYLQIGDTISSREWFQRVAEDQFLQDLGLGVCAIADSDWESAESILKRVESSVTAEKEVMSKVSINNNLAVAKIYRGKLGEAITLLEDMTEKGMISSTLLLNLSILYDLRQEVGKKAKTQLLYVLKDKGYQALETYEFL